jgi:PmbA protein
LFGAIGSAPFDDDGVATSPKTIVDSGTLETYLLGAYSARRLKLEPTGNAGGVHNLIVGHQDRALDELIADLDKALLVTELMGFGVNTVTGDYSRGASGFFISEGKIDHPVEEITIAGNLKTMLLGIQTIANDVDRRGNIHTGSILIDKMAIAGA